MQKCSGGNNLYCASVHGAGAHIRGNANALGQIYPQEHPLRHVYFKQASIDCCVGLYDRLASPESH